MLIIANITWGKCDLSGAKFLRTGDCVRSMVANEGEDINKDQPVGNSLHLHWFPQYIVSTMIHILSSLTNTQ